MKRPEEQFLVTRVRWDKARRTVLVTRVRWNKARRSFGHNGKVGQGQK